MKKRGSISAEPIALPQRISVSQPANCAGPITILLLICLTLFAACKGKSDKPADAEDAAPAEVKTPVTTAAITYTRLEDSIELNATSTFLQNNYIRSTATGYIRTVSASLGQYTEPGKTLFIVETKESMVIGNSITKLDSTFKFSGVNNIRSSASGYITQLNHQLGDYVQDGEQLAVISDRNSFVFLLNLPYELRPYVLNKKQVDLLLPDGVQLKGEIRTVMPTVDSLSQTQQVVIRVNTDKLIPQNLIARVRIIKEIRENAQVIPKSALLSDESQSSFWVMKMLDSTTAVKTIVKKGMEVNGQIQITEPAFTKDDRIVISGNYGLPDTAKVIVEKP